MGWGISAHAHVHSIASAFEPATKQCGLVPSSLFPRCCVRAFREGCVTVRELPALGYLAATSL